MSDFAAEKNLRGILSQPGFTSGPPIVGVFFDHLKQLDPSSGLNGIWSLWCWFDGLEYCVIRLHRCVDFRNML